MHLFGLFNVLNKIGRNRSAYLHYHKYALSLEPPTSKPQNGALTTRAQIIVPLAEAYYTADDAFIGL